jgi:hypothetical protein
LAMLDRGDAIGAPAELAARASGRLQEP